MQHKWHKEIKAWADGAEIEFLSEDGWLNAGDPEWNEDSEYRIKPQLKEPQYLLAILLNDGQTILGRSSEIIPLGKGQTVNKIIGKIKLEVDDD
jgi:hypothetical protein